ncbi:hypothetical protein [Streptomyces lydicus]|uniref:hypothetical protein n=1 Tax=Streptomyces lydicus TaxID=47763 RepID=UPI0037BD50B8
MPVPAPHLQDLVTAYLHGHPDEQPLLQPLLGRLAAGANVIDRRAFDGHVTTSGVVINDAEDVLLIHHLAPTVKNLSCALVVITDPATTKVLMHLRDDKPGIWAP